MTEEELKEYDAGFCRFCLGKVYQPYPDRCPHCDVVSCTCGTFLKGQAPTFCYGCGTLNPQVRAGFCRGSSTGMVYIEDAWGRRNLGSGCTMHTLGSGYVYKNADGSVDRTRTGYVVSKNLGNGKYEDVRFLSEEEVASLRKE